MQKLFNLFFILLLPIFSFSQASPTFYTTDYNYPYVLGTDNFLDSNNISFYPRISYSIYSQKDQDKSEPRNILLLGYKLKYSINNYLEFNSSVTHIDGAYPNSIKQYVDSLSIYPGFGKILEKGYNYTFSLSYRISNNFTLDIGKGNHFIGSGYRSLLLSNEATSYPYALITSNFWDFNYYNLYTSFSDVRDPNNYYTKYATIHYLNYTPTDYISIGFFESVIWQAQDSIYNRGYDISYLNPVIFYRPVEFSKKSPDNVLMGMNILYKYKEHSLYAQVLLDDLNIVMKERSTGDDSEGGFFQDKYAYQVGMKLKNIFSVKHLDILTEFNQVQPYTYAHKTPMQNYTHFNQSLAHPMGANFQEFLAVIDYHYKDWKFLLKYVHCMYGADSLDTHYGQNIFLSDHDAQKGLLSFGNFNGQGIKTELQNIYAEASYLIPDFYNMRAYVGFALRRKSSEILNQHESYIIIGARTFLHNPFKDY